jgi:curved DNA-binding protein CbpA
MTSPYDRLGISSTASPAEIKAAYHAKLREFPAHTHPQEFKAIRTAYESIRQGETAESGDFFKVRSLEASLDTAALQQLRERLASQLAIGLEDLLRETF